jgi:N-acetylmuramoyl-L-alanine amidase
LVQLNYKKKHIKKHWSTRPGIKLLRIQAGIDHYTANPGADADNHFKYFDETLPNENDKKRAAGIERGIRFASAHIFVDRFKALELVPLDEVCFGANERIAGPLLSALRATHPKYPGGNANLLCIHIEMCVEPDGTIHPDTIKRTALVHQYLQKLYPQLKDTYNRFVRHFDVTGKNCPAPMVKEPSLYKYLLDMTAGNIEINPKAKPQQKEEEEVIKKAVVVYSDADLSVGYDLANEKKCGLYNRKSLANETLKINELMVVGGPTEGLEKKTNRVIDLSGTNRWDTRKKVIHYLGK